MVTFRDNPEVFCTWAKSHTNRKEALAILSTPLDDGSWIEAPAVYIRHLSWPPFWHGETAPGVRQLRGRLIDKILSGTLEDNAAHAALPDLFNTADLAPLEEAAKITNWLVQNAGPNDAPMIADVVEHVTSPSNKYLQQDCFPLVVWLLTNGSSELRSGRRSQLVADLVPLVAQFGSDELLAAAIRYVLYNERRVGLDGWVDHTIRQLLPAVERVLERSQSEGIIGDLAAAFEPGPLGQYLEMVLHAWTDFPRSRAAMIRRLAVGEMGWGNRISLADIWVLILGGPAVDVAIVDVHAAAEGLATFALCEGVSDARPSLRAQLRKPPTEPQSKAGWGYIIAREFLRATDLLATRSASDILQLQKCAGLNMTIASGVHRAVVEAVERSGDPALNEVQAMLTSPETEPMVVVPALDLLTTVPAARPRAKETVAVDHVVEAVERLLLHEGPTVSGFTFRKVVGGAVASIRIADLPDQRAFMVEGETLAISKEGIERLCALSDDPEAQRALAVLYTLHEVVHLFQGAAGMGRVAEVRFAGAESALMHIDLGADHVAAVMANAIFPEWDLLWLKDWQGLSIRGFPAGARNPPYSRIRKTLRLVGLRVDLALRKLGIGSEHLTRESYGFGDFSPSGGAFIAMVNRPPFAVVKTSTIDPAEASVLFEGIEGEVGAIERVDEVVVKALRR